MAAAPAAPPPTPASAIASPAYKWTIGLALAALQSLVYFGIGHLHLSRSTEILRTRLDDAIPFWPWTAWCYLPFYAGVFIIAIGGIKRRALFNRAWSAVLIVMTMGALGHIFIGAEYPRPCSIPPYADISQRLPGVGPAHRSAGQRVSVAARRAHDDAGADPDQGPPAAGPRRAGDGDRAGAVDADDQAALHRGRGLRLRARVLRRAGSRAAQAAGRPSAPRARASAWPASWRRRGRRR